MPLVAAGHTADPSGARAEGADPTPGPGPVLTRTPDGDLATPMARGTARAVDAPRDLARGARRVRTFDGGGPASSASPTRIVAEPVAPGAGERALTTTDLTLLPDESPERRRGREASADMGAMATERNVLEPAG